MTDVDDEELGALFRAAASDPAAPEPGFDHAAVVNASRRATVRRRAAITGTGLALIAVVGVGTGLVLPDSDGGGDAASVAAPMIAPGEEARDRPDAAEPAEPAEPRARPDAAAPADPGARPRPEAAAPGDPGERPDGPSPADPRAEGQAPPPAAEGGPEAARVPEAAAGGPRPLGPGTGECADRQDPALRALVEQVLPEVVGAPEAATTMECRPGGERGVNVEVRDGAATGLLTVQYLPPGARPEPVEGAVEGAVVAPTASGGTVLVSSRPEEPGDAAPLADRLPEAVSYLAPRL
jgi:hypothetical protein